MTEPAAASLHEIAEQAHLDWAVHWSVCPARKADGYCACCDQLDLAANAAESAERRAALAETAGGGSGQ